MERKERTCAVCRQNYKFCPHCNEDKDKPLWMFTFCSSNCKDIYDVTSKFENELIDINKAKKQLSKLDLSKLDNFGESYKSTIAKINVSTSSPIIAKTNSITKTEVLSESIITENETEGMPDEKDEIVEEVIDEEKVLKKPKNKRAKIDVEE